MPNDSPQPFVTSQEEADPFSPPHHDGTTSIELINPDLGSDNVVFRISSAPPGGGDIWHAHEESEQLCYVLEGEATMWIGEPGNDDEADATTYHLEPESFVYLPPNTYHRMEVTGDETFQEILIWVPPYGSLSDWGDDNP